MFGPGLQQREVQELPEAYRIGDGPRHGPLRFQTLEVAEQQHSELATWGQRRPADAVGVELRALLLDEGIEARLVGHAVQSFLARQARR